MANILIVYIEPTPYIVDLADRLVERCAHHVTIMFLYENYSQNWNMPLHQAYSIFPSQIIKRYLFIKKIFSKKNYDLIHLAGWGNVWLLLILMLARMNHVPVVVESDTPYKVADRISFKMMCKNLIKRLLYPFLFGKIDLFLAGGLRQVKYIAHYGVPLARIVTMDMTVNTIKIKQHIETLTAQDRDHFRESLGIPKNTVLYLFVGRLIKIKGLKYLLDVFSSLSFENISLLIIGDGDLKPFIMNVVNKCHNIYYAGRLTNQALFNAYYAADVVVLPAHCEPWGLVINEAMICARPVIVSDQVGCLDDLVTHLETGLVVKDEDKIALRRAIAFMAHHPEERRKMGEHSSSKISRWTLENESEKIQHAWHQVLC